MAPPPSPAREAPAVSIMLQFTGMSIQSSPFEPGKLAIATAANFGLVGNGRLEIVQLTASFELPWSFQHLASIDTSSGLRGCAWSELIAHQVATAGNGGTIKLWDLQVHSGHPISAYDEHSADVSAVEWNLTSKDCFASCSWDATAKLWYPEVAAAVLTFVGHTAPVYDVRWAPRHPSQLLSAAGDGTVRLWDAKAGPAEVLSCRASASEVLSVDWSKYVDDHFATASVDGDVRVWDLRELSQPLQSLNAHKLAACRVRFCPHAPTVLLSASYDKSVSVWDYASPTSPLLRRYEHHAEFVTAIEFSLFQEGVLISSGWDNALHAWAANYIM